MVFTHLARVVAAVALLAGILSVWWGAIQPQLPQVQLEPHHVRLNNKSTSDGLMLIAVGLALGTLAEISLSLRDKTKPGQSIKSMM
jgi:hypothetical protein